MKSYLSRKKASQMQTFTGTTYAPFTAKQSPMQERILYQTESLELLHLISLLSKICSLGQSIPHLPSCIPVSVGSWTATRPASPVAYQMFVRSVEWHHTVTLCIVALRVGVGGWQFHRHVSRIALPFHFLRHFCCKMYRLAAIAVGCIVHPQHSMKNWSAEISASWIAMVTIGYSSCGIFGSSVLQLYRVGQKK